MGNARYDDHAWTRYSDTTTKGRSREEIFTQRTMHSDLDPAKIKLREAVDSPANPETTPIKPTSPQDWYPRRPCRSDTLAMAPHETT